MFYCILYCIEFNITEVFEFTDYFWSAIMNECKVSIIELYSNIIIMYFVLYIVIKC